MQEAENNMVEVTWVLKTQKKKKRRRIPMDTKYGATPQKILICCTAEMKDWKIKENIDSFFFSWQTENGEKKVKYWKWKTGKLKAKISRFSNAKWVLKKKFRFRNKKTGKNEETKSSNTGMKNKMG